eukprot:2242856-Rhodomonas_salina.1
MAMHDRAMYKREFITFKLDDCTSDCRCTHSLHCTSDCQRLPGGRGIPRHRGPGSSGWGLPLCLRGPGPVVGQ